MTLQPGTRLGTYVVSAPLGAGGMGEVYRARDTRLGREVALKILQAEVASSPERLARFQREARVVAGLNHPNIVTLYSFEEEDGVPFLTMELVEGRSLQQLVVPGGLPFDRLLELGGPIANALTAAHERGVVHRDLKPGNIMVTPDGIVKTLDFGLAKLATTPEVQDARTATADGPFQEPLTGSGEVFGTVPYMAPEQIRGEPVDARADLFALGVILYELATGRRPFTGAAAADVASAILRDSPPPLSALRPDLPRDLDRIVSRCLEKQPRDRFQTARDVQNELRYLQRTVRPPSSGGDSAPALPAAPAVPNLPSVAVLPFVNRSRSEEDEYFSDGLADELLRVLTKIRNLRVVARASSFQFKGKNEDLAVIGERLRVANLLDGSVRKSGHRVRITVQLVRASDHRQLWSETYDRRLDDIFAVQDEIAQSVVEELRATLLGGAPGSDVSLQARADVALAAKGHGRDAEAHRLYLQGKYFLDRMTEADVERGLQHLVEAVALDPTHTFAWVEISRAHGIRGGYGWEPVSEAAGRSREAIQRALALEPDSADALVRLGNIQIYSDWDWRGAGATLRRAYEVAPTADSVLRSCGSLALALGRYQEAEGFFRRAVEVDPLNAFAYQWLSLTLRFAERFQEAEAAQRMALDLAPHRTRYHGDLAKALADLGRHAEALAEAQSEAVDWARLDAVAYADAKAGRSREPGDALEQLIARHGDSSAFQIAENYGLRGEGDEALTWLERAVEGRDPGAVMAKAVPAFRPLHGEPRWAALMKRLGFDA